MESPSSDVIVIGAGVAGLAAAESLSSAGLHVLLTGKPIHFLGALTVT